MGGRVETQKFNSYRICNICIRGTVMLMSKCSLVGTFGREKCYKVFWRKSLLNIDPVIN